MNNNKLVPHRLLKMIKLHYDISLQVNQIVFEKFQV